MTPYTIIVIHTIILIMNSLLKMVQARSTLLLPGLGASRLLYKNKNIYPPYVSDFIFGNKEWKQHIIENQKLHTLPLGDKGALDLSISPLLSSRNVYAKLVEKSHIHPIPYDFRRIDQQQYLSELCQDIKHYIERQPEPVTLLCHSTGGLLAHWLLHQQPLSWRKTWINKVINLNVPFGGTVSVLLHCINDNEFMNKFLSKEIVQSIGAAVWNMPNPKYLNHPILVYDGAVVEDYMERLHLQNIKERWKNNQHIIDSFAHWTEVDTEIVYCFTPDISTPFSLVLEKDGKDPVVKPVMGSGDGVVSESSLIVPRMWGDIDRVKFTNIHNSSHSKVLLEPRF
jgi:Lecithin:cholesterol acyltransferase